MKKLLSLLLVFSLILTLSACTITIGRETTPSGTQETEAPTEAPTAEVPTEAPTETPTETTTEAPTQAPTEAPTEAEGDSIRGTIDGTVYTNAFGGITFDAPEDAYYFSDDEIAAIFNASAEMMGTNTSDKVVYDMVCQIPPYGSINVTFENMGILYGKIISEKNYLNVSVANLERAFENVEETELKSCEVGTVTLNGVEYNCIRTSLRQDIFLRQQILLVKKIGDFMMVCGVTAGSEEELEDILSWLTIA